MRIFSTFSGIGGFEVGIQNALINYCKCVNCAILKTQWKKKEYARSAKNQETFIKAEGLGVNCVTGKMQKDCTGKTQKSTKKQSFAGKAETQKSTKNTTEALMPKDEKSFSTTTEEPVSAVVKATIDSSRSTTLTTMGQKIDGNTARDIHTNSQLSEDSQTPIRHSAITATTVDSYTGCVLTKLEVVGFSEIDKYARSVYERNFQNSTSFGDITKINADELPDFDCLVGGFPCQAFSIAGKRKGFEDTRGTLFFDLARILRAKQPRLFVFENVKGLLNHDSGHTFKTIIATIDELGYDCQWQVLNSKNFGVPQNRERVYIVGHRRGTRRPDVFPIEYNYGRTKPTITERVYYLQGDPATYARELVLGMAQQQGQEVSREQVQELFERAKQSLATGESSEIAEEREAVQSQPERDIQEVGSIGTFLGSEYDTSGVLGVVSIPTEDLLLLWNTAGDAANNSRQVQQQDLSIDDRQGGLAGTLRVDKHSPLLLAVQPYQGRLFYSVGDGRDWTKLCSVKMEDIKWQQQNTLASVLEEHPDPKYFLSPEQTQRILSLGLSERAVPQVTQKNTLET